MGTLLNSFWFSPPPPPPPVTPVIPPVTPVIPPVTPVIPPVVPPVTPVIPPVTPVIPPVTPVIPPVSPVIPPVSPVIPPVSPVIPPAPPTIDSMTESSTCTTITISWTGSNYQSWGVTNSTGWTDPVYGNGCCSGSVTLTVGSCGTARTGTLRLYSGLNQTGTQVNQAFTISTNSCSGCTSPVSPVIPPVTPVIPPVTPVIPPVSPVIPPVSPVAPPGGCPVGTCPWYGRTCTALDAYYTGCTEGSCDIENGGNTCVITCSAVFC